MIIFSDGDRQIRKYENGKFWQVLRIDDGLVLAILEAAGSVDDPKLLVCLKSNRKISRDSKEKARQTVNNILNLDLDLKVFYEYVRNDKILAEVIRQLRGLRGPTTPTVFEALVDSIIEQQISLNVAHVLETKLVKAFGESLSLDNEVYYAYPTPLRLASAGLQQLRKCGLSQKKAEYITGISGLISAGKLDLERFRDCDDAGEIVSELDKIRGIGVWTAELTMVRGMARMEVMPADDLGLRRTISHFYRNDREISSEEARKIGEEWGKWKGLAAFYLIIAEILEQEKV
jgi:DNA-3-methyladenine glycosylase II